MPTQDHRQRVAAERVSSGLRLVARLARDHPLAATFLVRLGWPDARGPSMPLGEAVQEPLSPSLPARAYRQQESRRLEVSVTPATMIFRTPSESRVKVPHLSARIGPAGSGTIRSSKRLAVSVSAGISSV